MEGNYQCLAGRGDQHVLMELINKEILCKTYSYINCINS